MKIVELTVWYRNKRTENRESLSEKPHGQSIVEIKVQVGQMIKKIENKALYYYVVVAARRADGQKGYRTVIPKTVV